MTEVSLEGWFDDPYGRHEARWLSSGVPTRLVRDSGMEGSDPVDGDTPFETSSLRRAATAGLSYGTSDLRRADDVNRYSRPPGARRGGWTQGLLSGTNTPDRAWPWMGEVPSAYTPVVVQRPFGQQQMVFVDPARPKAVALFLSSGIVGWSLLGVVLAFAHAPWIPPVLGVASLAIGAQYVAWWQLGGKIGLLRVNGLTQMSRMVGLPKYLGSLFVYASMTWVGIALVRRWHLMSPTPSLVPDHSWVALLAAYVFGLGFVVVGLLALAGQVRDAIGPGWTGNRNRWLSRYPLRRWMGQIAMVFGTAAALLFVTAHLG